MPDEMTEFYYRKGYVQGKIDFAKEVTEQVKLIVESCNSDERSYECDYAYDGGVDWAVSEILRIIDEKVGDLDGRE